MSNRRKLERPKTAIVGPPRTHAAMLERMVPNATDLLTETLHWQRYTFFRSWYEGRTVVDYGSGEGYGTNYASIFAKQAVGVERDPSVCRHAARKYPSATFEQADGSRRAPGDVDVVLGFDFLECLDDPGAWLDTVAQSGASVALSTPNRLVVSPGRGALDRPRNRFRKREYSPEEFEQLVRAKFPGREIAFFSQEARWHGPLQAGLSATAISLVAAVGPLPAPSWPKVGLAMPTVNNVEGAGDAILAIMRTYAGPIEIAWVLNGTSSEGRRKAETIADRMNGAVHLVHLSENQGFAAGCNAGLAALERLGGFDWFGVTNDDVAPAVDCLAEMVAAMEHLDEQGLRPGVIGPVSNNVHGHQQVSIGEIADYRDMLVKAEPLLRAKALSVTRVQQLRGLFMLIHPRCLAAVGGFDPLFGLGNFEDDDHNVRTALAGFSLWMADGAFLYHMGSTTFRKLDVDYQALIRENGQKLCDKWRIASVDDVWAFKQPPIHVALRVPLDAAVPARTKPSDEPAPQKLSIVTPTVAAEAASEPVVEEPLVVAANEPRAFLFPIDGKAVDLVNGLSHEEFGAWVAACLALAPRSARLSVIHTVIGATEVESVESLRRSSEAA